MLSPPLALSLLHPRDELEWDEVLFGALCSEENGLDESRGHSQNPSTGLWLSLSMRSRVRECARRHVCWDERGGEGGGKKRSASQRILHLGWPSWLTRLHVFPDLGRANATREAAVCLSRY